jgi:hypothetical protein
MGRPVIMVAKITDSIPGKWPHMDCFSVQDHVAASPSPWHKLLDLLPLMQAEWEETTRNLKMACQKRADIPTYQNLVDEESGRES